MKPLAFRHILVATDLSPKSMLAVQNAQQLADLSGAELHVLHVAEDLGDSKAAEKRLADALGKTSESAEVNVMTGPAGPLITQEAARCEADVIVLGAHRKSTEAPGSTADFVVRTARVSCLILPETLALPLRFVLVPVDDNDTARGALSVGLTWASALRQRGAEHTTVHAFHVLSNGQPKGRPQGATPLRDLVEEITNRLADVAGVDIEQHIARGQDVPRTILQEAENEEADLVVLGTRGERITDDPLGSVSSAVVKSATKPVLLVPPEVWRRDAGELIV